MAQRQVNEEEIYYDHYNCECSRSRICDEFLIFLSWLLIIISFPFSLFFVLKVVREYERVVIFRLGRILGDNGKGPGLYFTIPCVDSSTTLDIRIKTYDVPSQEILSKDSVTVYVDAVVFYRITNTVIAVINIEDYSKSTHLLATTTIRNVLSSKMLSEILLDLEAITNTIRVTLDELTEQWGVQIERIEIKDIHLPEQLQRAMAAEAEADREAKAQLIIAEGEKKASNAFKEAAEELSTSPISLRYLHTLNDIAMEKNSTIIFPLPLDYLKNFFISS